MTTTLQNAFEAIGADAIVESTGDAFEIDIRQTGDGEAFRLQYPWSDVITAEAIDIKPKLRHLVLDVTGWRLPISSLIRPWSVTEQARDPAKVEDQVRFLAWTLT